MRIQLNPALLSTPIGETSTRNIEHYWGWDIEDMRIMLTRAGWQTEYRCDAHYLSRDGSSWSPASYQVWGYR
jgi:hypothetical protein